MGDLKKFQIGESVGEFPARTWNALVRGEERDRARAAEFAARLDSIESWSSVRVLVRNDSGSLVPAGGVLKLSGVLVEPSDQPSTVFDGPMFTGATPTAAAPDQHLAVMIEPTKDKYAGYGIVPGAVWAKVNVSNVAHQFAQPKAAVDELESSDSSGYPIIWKEGGAGAGKWAVVALQRPSRGNVLYAQVNEASGVTPGDATFTFDNAIAIVGNMPTGTSGTAQNQYLQAYANDEWVLLFEAQLTGQWLTERGGLAGSQVVYFELTQNKSYGDAAKLAKPVLIDGSLDTGADAFHVVDDQHQFYGKIGYRGFAVRYTDEYSEDVPGYRIITMEGPAHLMVVALSTSYSGSGTTCTPVGSTIYGKPFRGERLPPTGDVTVYDDLSVAYAASIGDKWLIAFDEIDEHYIFVAALDKLKLRYKGTGTLTPATPSITFTPPTPLVGPPLTSITVANDPDLLNDGDPIYAIADATAAGGFSTADMGNFVPALKGLKDWDAGVNLPRCLARTDADKLVWERLEILLTQLDSFSSGSSATQVIGHDGAKAIWRDEAGGGGGSYFAGCGLNLSSGTFSVDPVDLAGPGLIPAETGCALQVNVDNCTLGIVGDVVAVDLASIAGQGLIATYGTGICQLDVQVGCGLKIESDAVVVDVAALAGDGLVNTTGCALEVSVGCGLKITGGAVEVDAPDLAGDYLTAGEGCVLNVDNVTVDIITSLNSIDLVLESGELKVKLNYTKRAGVKILAGGTESTTTLEGGIAETDCSE